VIVVDERVQRRHFAVARAATARSLALASEVLASSRSLRSRTQRTISELCDAQFLAASSATHAFSAGGSRTSTLAASCFLIMISP
jgi:hypothetical protein